MRKICLLFVLCVFALGARPQEYVTTFGIQFKPVIPQKFLRAGGVADANDSLILEVNPRYGSSIGMVIRKGINNRISFEGGINLINRNYHLKGGRTSGELFEQTFKWVSYEIPLQALVFVRLGEHLYVNGAGGFSLDFFPSDVEGSNRDYYHRTLRRSWIKPALIANLGAEWRTDHSGYFYLGTSYHQPFSDMAVTQISTLTGGKDVLRTLLNGSYLTIDLRYFFHEDRQKFKKLRDSSNDGSL